MQIAKISIGLILAGAMGVLVASWRSDFSESSGKGSVPAGATAARRPAPAEEHAPEISFDLLVQTGFSDEKTPPEYPKPLRDLVGKRVRITGFITPYNDPRKMTKLLLLRSPTGCFYCNPPEINAVVFIRRAPKDQPLNQDGQPMSFAGTLRLWSLDLKDTDETRQFLFTLDDAVVLDAR